METYGNLDGGIVATQRMAQPWENAITSSSESLLTENTTKNVHYQMLWRMRCFTPTFPSQLKSMCRSLDLMWGKSKNNLTIASLPDMGDDEDWEEEEIYK